MNTHNSFLNYPSGYTYTRPMKVVHTQQHERVQGNSCLLFSVIICTYNRRNFVLTALASLRKQTLPYDLFEVIVIDNNSTDGTFNAIQTYLATDLPYKQKGEKTWQAQCLLEPLNGLIPARQTALTQARGEFVVFLDDDTIADTHFLEGLQKAYAETNADAIGGRVELYWESSRPYWLVDDLLDTLGYFAPSKTRVMLPDNLNFSSSCFSIKRSILQTLGSFTPTLGKRSSMLINVDVNDLCRRLRQVDYHLWYEPSAFILHRVPPVRLQTHYFIGKAYWDGRAEIAEYYTETNYQGSSGDSLFATIRSILPDIHTMLTIMLVHRLLLYLARKPASEQLSAAMAQWHMWGRIQQQFLLSNHLPLTPRLPAILIVSNDEQSILPLLQGLKAENIHCQTSLRTIPFNWLWRHRAYPNQCIGVVHMDSPGAFHTGVWQRLCLLWKLWLAHKLGLIVVSSDHGGEWQAKSGLRTLAQRLFERMVFAQSSLIHTFAPAEKLYDNPRLRDRAYFHTHPGMIGILPQLIERKQVYTYFDLPRQKSFVYLCFNILHTEKELLLLIDDFTAIQRQTASLAENIPPPPIPHLLLLGAPERKSTARKLIIRAQDDPTIHLHLSWNEQELAYAVEAANALVLPYFSHKAAGIPRLAMLFYSYERTIIAPDLPRFHDLLPIYASVLFDPCRQDRRDTIMPLQQAMLIAQTRSYHHTDQEARMLAYKRSWQHYAHAIIQSYRPLLPREMRKD